MATVRVRRPAAVLRNAASLPAISGLPGGSALSDTLSSLIDSLPSMASLPTPVNIANLPVPPSPRGIASTFENILPAGAPKVSQFFPDIAFDGLAQERGLKSTISGSYRSLETTARTPVRAGGYRSI